MPWQPEDQHRCDMGRILLGQKPLYQAKWEALSTHSSASANHEEQASGLSVWSRYQPGIKYLLERLEQGGNNFLRGETMADPPHYAFSLEGMMFQRKYALRDMNTHLAEIVDQCILQWWAQLALCADSLESPERCTFAWAHQRSVHPMGSNRTVIDYYFRRGLGLSHSATGLEALADRITDGKSSSQEPFHLRLFADSMATDLRHDVGRIMSAYNHGGFEAIARLIRRGSRGTWWWVRLSNGGYIHLVEQDYGVDEARHICMREGLSTPLLQFPAGLVERRLYRESWAKLDPQKGEVSAWDQIYGTFNKTFNPSLISLLVKSSPSGVEIKTKDEEAPPIPPIPPVQPPKEDRPSWIERMGI